MNIKPTDKTIRALLEGGFYKIPRFQRPYSWDQENVDDFWSDAIASEDPDCFIGSFVLFRDNPHSDLFMVVDGQQRLTTTTILLAAIRNAFDGLGEADLAKGTQSLIERTDVNNKLRYVLLTETSYPYLQEYIQKHGSPELKNKSGAEENAIEGAFKYLTGQVDATLAAIENDPSVAAKKKHNAKRLRLVSMRNNLLRLQLIAVELQNEDDAYVIFETLNTRGKDLGIADLVKNLITKLLKPKNSGVDVARDKWRTILNLLDESAERIKINTFIYHSWLSRSSYTGREKLFRAMKAKVSASNAVAYLNDLMIDADLYRQILEPDSGKWSSQEAAVRTSLKALASFKVGQPLPMILAILRAYRDKDITLAKTKEVLQSLENFHVQFTALTAQRTGGGTAKMYAAAAQELTHAKSPQRRADAIKVFREKLRARVPSYAQFEASVEELEFTTTNTKQKTLMQYLLRRLDTYQRKGPPVDYSKMTIEHIAPENPLAGSTHVNAVGKLGNLVLLDEATNNKVANKGFAEKLATYKASHVPLDTTLTNASKWTDKLIETRTKLLAKIAFEKIFRV